MRPPTRYRKALGREQKHPALTRARVYTSYQLLLAAWPGFERLLGKAESGLCCARRSLVERRVSLHRQRLLRPATASGGQTPGADGRRWRPRLMPALRLGIWCT